MCTYKLVHDEYFNLWDTSNLKFLRWNNDLRANYIISDWLYFIGFMIFCISAIGISVKSHIGAPLPCSSSIKNLHIIYSNSWLD